jgi:hypothetical protein
VSALSKQLARLGIRPKPAPPLSHVEEIAALVEDFLAQPPSPTRASDFAELHAVMTLWLPVAAGGMTHAGEAGAGCDHAQVRIDPTHSHLICKGCDRAVSPIWWLARFHGVLADERAAAQAELERIQKAIATLQAGSRAVAATAAAAKRPAKRRRAATGTRSSQLAIDEQDPNLQGEVKR